MRSLNLNNRTYEEKLILIGSLVGVLCFFPFTVYRYLIGDYLLAAIESALVVCLLGILVYIWRTHRIEGASVFISVLCMGVMAAVVHIKGPELIYWLYPATMATFCITHQRTASVISLLTGLLMFPSIYPRLVLTEVLLIYSSLTMFCVFCYTFTVVTRIQRLQLSELAEQDALTGALNRRSLDESMLAAISLAKREPQFACSLVILDLDHFKDINDTYGHNIGDQILIRMAELIRSTLRVSDRLYRYGGEEFVVMLDDTHIKDAHRIAENIRERVEKAHLFDKRGVTISIGVAQLKPALCPGEWLTLADDALYEAKRGGRNQVCVANQSGLSVAA